MIFNGKEYELWLDKIAKIFKVNFITVSLIVSGSTFLFTFLIALIGGFGKQFLYTKQIYLGVFGIFWVVASLLWGTSRYSNIWTEIKVCFNVSKSDYDKVVQKWLKRITNNWISFILTLFTGAPLYYLLIYSFTSNSSDKFKIVPCILPIFWYAHDTILSLKVLIITIYFWVVISLIVTAAWALVGHMLLTMDVGRFPLKEIYNASQRLISLASFSLIASVAWFVGVSLIIVLLENNLSNFVALMVVITLSVIGILLFFVPQITIHSSLEKEKENLLLRIGEEYDNLLEELLGSSEDKLDTITSRIDKIEKIKDYTANIRTWIYDLPTLIRLVAASLLPLLTFFLSK